MRTLTADEKLFYKKLEKLGLSGLYCELYDEFTDHIKSDPDFNYLINEFKDWFNDLILERQQ